MRRGASYSLSSPRMHADRSEGALPYPGNPRSPQQSERRDGMAVGWSGGDGEGVRESGVGIAGSSKMERGGMG